MPKDKQVNQQDEADEQALQPMDAAVEGIDLKGGGQLLASFVAEMLDCWRHIPKPYAQATQGQQQDVFRRFEALGRTMIQQIVERVAAGESDSIKCLVGKVSIDSEVKVDFKLAGGDEETRENAVLFLMHAKGKHVVVRRATAADYEGEPAVDPSQPDQNDLGFEAGDDELPEVPGADASGVVEDGGFVPDGEQERQEAEKAE